MRCKNCGYENDEKLYICENCGSPLYDEEELEENVEHTRTFDAAALNKASNPVPTPVPVPVPPQPKNNPPKKDDEEAKKKQAAIIVIVVLAVVLVAIIIGIIIAVASGNKTPDVESTSDVSITEYQDDTTKPYENKTTEATTEEDTTEDTTSTTASKLNLTLTCNDGGEVEGDGSYELGENVTIFARPDDGYEFGGWYNGSTKVSSSTKYTFTITGDTKLKAVFITVHMEDVSEETTAETTTKKEKPTQATTAQTTQSSDSDNDDSEVENLDGEDD